MTKQALLILAHGSRDPGARAEYRRLADEMAARLPEVTEQVCAAAELLSQQVNSIYAAAQQLSSLSASLKSATETFQL